MENNSKFPKSSAEAKPDATAPQGHALSYIKVINYSDPQNAINDDKVPFYIFDAPTLNEIASTSRSILSLMEQFFQYRPYSTAISYSHCVLANELKRLCDATSDSVTIDLHILQLYVKNYVAWQPQWGYDSEQRFGILPRDQQLVLYTNSLKEKIDHLTELLLLNKNVKSDAQKQISLQHDSNSQSHCAGKTQLTNHSSELSISCNLPLASMQQKVSTLDIEQLGQIYHMVSMLDFVLRHIENDTATRCSESGSVAFTKVLESLAAVQNNKCVNVHYSDLISNLDKVLDEALTDGAVAYDYPDAHPTIRKFLNYISEKIGKQKPSFSASEELLLLSNVATYVFQKMDDVNSASETKKAHRRQSVPVSPLGFSSKYFLSDLPESLKNVAMHISAPKIKQLMLVGSNIFACHLRNNTNIIEFLSDNQALPLLKRLYCTLGIMSKCYDEGASDDYDAVQAVFNAKTATQESIKFLQSPVPQLEKSQNHFRTSTKTPDKPTRTSHMIRSRQVAIQNVIYKIVRINLLSNKVCSLLKDEPLYQIILKELKSDTEFVCGTDIPCINSFDEVALLHVAGSISRKAFILLSQNLPSEAHNEIEEIYALSASIKDLIIGPSTNAENQNHHVLDILEQLMSLDRLLIPRTSSNAVDIKLFHIRILVESCIAGLIADYTGTHCKNICDALNRATDLAADVWGTEHTIYFTLQDCAKSASEIKVFQVSQDANNELLATSQNVSAAYLKSTDINSANSVTSASCNGQISTHNSSIFCYGTDEFKTLVAKLADLGRSALLSITAPPTLVHSLHQHGYTNAARTSAMGLCPSNWTTLKQTSEMLSLLDLLMQDIGRCTDPAILKHKKRELKQGFDSMCSAGNGSFARHSNYVITVLGAIIYSVNSVARSNDLPYPLNKATEILWDKESENLQLLDNLPIYGKYFQLVVDDAVTKLSKQTVRHSAIGASISDQQNSSACTNNASLKDNDASWKSNYKMLNLPTNPYFLDAPVLEISLEELLDSLEGIVSIVKKDNGLTKVTPGTKTFLTDIKRAISAVHGINCVYRALTRHKTVQKLSDVLSFSDLEKHSNHHVEGKHAPQEAYQQSLLQDIELAFSCISHAKMVGPLQNSGLISSLLHEAAALLKHVMSRVGLLDHKTYIRELSDKIECTHRFIKLLQSALHSIATSERDSKRVESILRIQQRVEEARLKAAYINTNDIIVDYSAAPLVRELMAPCLKELYDLRHDNTHQTNDEVHVISDINHHKAAILACRAVCHLLPRCIVTQHVSFPTVESPLNMDNALSRGEIIMLVLYEATQTIQEIFQEIPHQDLEFLNRNVSEIVEVCMSKKSHILDPSTIIRRLEKTSKLCEKVSACKITDDHHQKSIEKVKTLIHRALVLAKQRQKATLDGPLPQNSALVDIPFFPGENIIQEDVHLNANVDHGGDNTDEINEHSPSSRSTLSLIICIVVLAIIAQILKLAKRLKIQTKYLETQATYFKKTLLMDIRRDVTSSVDTIHQCLPHVRSRIQRYKGRITRSTSMLEMINDTCERSALLATHAIESQNLADTLEANCHLIGSHIIVKKAVAALSFANKKLLKKDLESIQEKIVSLRDNLSKSSAYKSLDTHTLHNSKYNRFGKLIYQTDAFITYGVLSAALWNSNDPVSELKAVIKEMRGVYPKNTELTIPPYLFYALFTHQHPEVLDVVCKNCTISDDKSGNLQAVFDIFAKHIGPHNQKQKRNPSTNTWFFTRWSNARSLNDKNASDMLTLLIKNSCLEKKAQNKKRYIIPSCNLDGIIEALCKTVNSTRALHFLLNDCEGGVVNKAALLKLRDVGCPVSEKIISDFIDADSRCHLMNEEENAPEIPQENLGNSRCNIQRWVKYEINPEIRLTETRKHDNKVPRYGRDLQQWYKTIARVELDGKGSMSLIRKPINLTSKKTELSAVFCYADASGIIHEHAVPSLSTRIHTAAPHEDICDPTSSYFHEHGSAKGNVHAVRAAKTENVNAVNNLYNITVTESHRNLKSL